MTHPQLLAQTTHPHSSSLTPFFLPEPSHQRAEPSGNGRRGTNWQGPAMAKGLGLQGCSPLDTSGPKPELTTALDLHSLQERRTLTCLRARAGWRKGPSLSACPSWLDGGFSGAQAPGWAGELALACACLHPGRMLVRRRSAPRALGCCVGAGTRRGQGAQGICCITQRLCALG